LLGLRGVLGQKGTFGAGLPHHQKVARNLCPFNGRES
jgi:hypothetical protein